MKLIIDIPEEIYREAITSGYSYQYDEKVANAVADGIPLDDVKAEIKAKEMVETDVARQFYNMALADAIQILDNISKAESENSP